MKIFNKTLCIRIISFTTIIASVSSCATIIGGNVSTKRSSGGAYGPASIVESNTTLTNDKLIALTVTNGDLTLDKFAIKYKLNVFGDLTINDTDLNGITQVGGMMNSNQSNFYQSCGILGNVFANNSYFAKDIEFSGNKMELTGRTKVVGNIINTSSTPVTIIIDHSRVKGNIGFANSNSVVIIQNRGYVAGQVINGKVQDLTGSDSYGGDDDN